MTCPACGGRGYTVSEHSDEHGVYQDTHECEECRHDLSETCACCGHWHGAHHEDQDGVRMHCEAAGCLCPEYMTIEDVMIDEHVRREKVRDAAREACRRLRQERDSARRELAALEWLTLRGYPVGQEPGGHRVSASPEPNGDPWFDSWEECARNAGMPG